MNITLSNEEIDILHDLIRKEVEISKRILGGDADNDEYIAILDGISEKLGG
jgi:hypothetical protein